MSTLDDAPPDSFATGSVTTTPTQPQPEPEPEYGERVYELLTAAKASRLVRTQALGTKAQSALDALARALKVELEIAEHAAAIARLRKGED